MNFYGEQGGGNERFCREEWDNYVTVSKIKEKNLLSTQKIHKLTQTVPELRGDFA